MRVLLPVLTAVLTTAAISSSVTAQPDFTGTWVATRDTPKSVGIAPSPVFGERFGLRGSGNSMTLLRVLRGATLESVFTLDGAETRTIIPGRPCFGDSASIASMTRDGQNLTFTPISSVPPGGQPVRGGPKYFFRLEAPDTLVVESTMRASAQAEPQQVGTVYRRSTDPMPPTSPAPAVKVAAATIADLAWLAGEWEGQRGTSTIEERWTPAAGGTMLAISRTTRAGTMPEFEFLCIAERAGGLVYTAMPNAGTQTDFLLTAITAESATFENPAHNFPKKIIYAKRADGGLDATISGAPTQKPITFSFQRRR